MSAKIHFLFLIKIILNFCEFFNAPFPAFRCNLFLFLFFIPCKEKGFTLQSGAGGFVLSYVSFGMTKR